VYSFFHLIDTFLDLKMNQTEDLRDRVNEIFLNEPESSPWILWNLGSATSSRLVTRIEPELVTAVSFLLFMMPGSISILYGDEIGLRPAVDVHSKKVRTH
jgi:glycosidase